MLDEDWKYSLDEMEGIIGGSTLDELRDLMGIEELCDGDIVFKLVEDPEMDLTEYHYYMQELYGIGPGKTFIARCLKHKTNDFKYVLEKDNDWIEL